MNDVHVAQVEARPISSLQLELECLCARVKVRVEERSQWQSAIAAPVM